jgi:5S rRNA maturation endonuclease (ribonuclease M5)
MERWEIEEWSKLHSEDEWRSFTGKFLKQFKALKALDKYGKPVMVLPVMVGKDLVGGIKCRWQKREGQLSYINSKGRWTRESGLWPYDYVQRMKPRCVWLVEGPRDAMRLLKYGIPALCMLGTQNWSEAKRDLVLALGVERVVSFTDGDKAGREAAYIIEDSFSDLIDLRLIKMWRLTKKLGLKKLDPFECPKKHLRRYVAKHHLQ